MTNNQKLGLGLVVVVAAGATAFLLLRKKKQEQLQQITTDKLSVETQVQQPAATKKDDTLKKVAIGTGVLALGIGLGEILSRNKKQPIQPAYSPAAKLGTVPAKTSTLLDAYGK